jgi:small conductance mechanosensitive channel
MIIKGRVRTKPIQQWAVGREYRKRLKLRFDAEGISIPFPQRDLYVKSVPEVLLSTANRDNSQSSQDKPTGSTV